MLKTNKQAVHCWNTTAPTRSTSNRPSRSKTAAHSTCSRPEASTIPDTHISMSQLRGASLLINHMPQVLVRRKGACA
jgi:hypothetical protein